MTTEEFNIDTVEEVVSLVENVSMEDFSLDLTPDDVVALDTIKKTVVGKFFIKRKIGNGRLRSIFSEMWNVSPWWRLQEISPKIFTFRFPRESDALKGIENVPWAPCGGFMLVTLMPDDEKGVLRSNYMRFRVSLDLTKPLLAGVGLDDAGGEKVWSYFKYERLPLFCYKCGVIGYSDDLCSARKRMMSLDDGRSVPLFGPWLWFGSRLENGFAVLNVEDIQERIHMEQDDDPNLSRDGHRGGSAGTNERIIQKDDNAFSIHSSEKAQPQRPIFPSVGLKFGLPSPFNKLRGGASSLIHKGGPKISKINIHFRALGPRGVLKKPIFRNRCDPEDNVVGTKRKKITHHGVNKFDDNNLTVNLGMVVEGGLKNVFVEGSSISGLPCLPTVEALMPPSLEIRCTKPWGRKNDKPESLVALEQDDGLFEDEEVVSSNTREDSTFVFLIGEHFLTISGSMSLISDANVARGRVTLNTEIDKEDFIVAEEASLIKPLRAP
uniref:Zinc knuckle CX2CX4HX4C domain-containing protein n=1 Tax=Cannabis sativa TaxID=3483 RepID=A0A803QE37_CANSA